MKTLAILLILVTTLSFAQEKTITGTVVDETNMPLPGATVIIKGATRGTSTDFDGNYKIKANLSDVLVFSYVGYVNKELEIKSSNVIFCELELDKVFETFFCCRGIKTKRFPDEITYSSTRLIYNGQTFQVK